MSTETITQPKRLTKREFEAKARQFKALFFHKDNPRRVKEVSFLSCKYSGKKNTMYVHLVPEYGRFWSILKGNDDNDIKIASAREFLSNRNTNFDIEFVGVEGLQRSPYLEFKN